MAIAALQSEIKGQLSAQFSEMKSEIQLLNSKLSEKDKLISELNLRIEQQEQQLLELEVKDHKLNLVVHGLRKKKMAKPLSKTFRIYSVVL